MCDSLRAPIQSCESASVSAIKKITSAEKQIERRLQRFNLRDSILPLVRVAINSISFRQYTVSGNIVVNSSFMHND